MKNRYSIEEKREFAKKRIIGEKKIHPLSPLQLGIWVHYRVYPESSDYNHPFVLKPLDSIVESVFLKSVAALVERHPILCGKYVEIKDSVYYVTWDDKSPKICFKDISNRCDDKSYQQMFMDDLFGRFNLKKENPFRVIVYKVDDKISQILFVVHHIVCDGGSMKNLISDFVDIYDSIDTKSGDFKPEATPQYFDYINKRFGSTRRYDLKSQISYWISRISDCPSITFPRFNHNSNPSLSKGRRIGIPLGSGLNRKISIFCKENAVTEYNFIQASFRILVSKYVSETDFCVGVPMSGLMARGYSESVGMFANALPVRVSVNPKELFREFVKRHQKEQLLVYRNSDVTFPEIVEALKLKVEPGRNPIYQISFQYQPNDFFRNNSGKNWEVVDVDHLWNNSKFDLSLIVKGADSDRSLVFEYRENLFDRKQILAMLRQLLQILETVLQQENLLVQNVDFLDEEQKQKIIFDFNDTDSEYPLQKCVHEFFQEQVALDGGAIAAVFEDEEVTYEELNERSNALADLLIKENGVGPDVLVGMCLERSIEMIVGILGILKAGGAYLPIDPDHPLERIEYILADSGVECLLVNERVPKGLNYNGILLDLKKQSASRYNFELQLATWDSSYLAYCIYTSGSTGKPKGVLCEHKGLVNRLLWMRDHYGFDKSDVIVQKTIYTFDVSIWELLLPGICGAKMILLKSGDERSPAAIEDAIVRHRATTIHFVPSMLGAYLLWLKNQRSYTHLKRVICSGEVLNRTHRNDFFSKIENTELHNLYGPTEASIDVTYCEVGVSDEIIPIGCPVANTQICILEENNDLVPIGVSGELCLEGVQLARGYLNRINLTDDKFSKDLFPGRRVYHTGDLARWLPDGNIEYLGRMDGQVKIRGFRVELGEIENVLNEQNDVCDSVVVTRDFNGEKVLVGYYVLEKKEYSNEDKLSSNGLNERRVNSSILRDGMRCSLPENMVPSFFIELDNMPLNVNGKIDRKALPDLSGGFVHEVEYVAPKGEIEHRIVRIWKDVIGVDKVGLNDNFFDLGGHSLMLIQVHSRLEKEGILKVTILDLYKYPTIKGLIDFGESLKDRKETSISESLGLGEQKTTDKRGFSNSLRKKRERITNRRK